MSVVDDAICRLQPTLDGLRMGFQLLDFEWRYIYINPAAAAHGRRRVEDLAGRTMLECYPSLEGTPLFQAMQRCMTGRTREVFDNLFVFADATERWFEIRVEPVAEGIRIYSLDIHDRKLRQLALEARHEEEGPLLQFPIPRLVLRALAGRASSERSTGGSHHAA